MKQYIAGACGAFLGLIILAGNFQTKGQEAVIKNFDGVIPVLSTKFPNIKIDQKEFRTKKCNETQQPCLDKFDIKLTLYKSDNNGVNTILVRKADQKQLLNFPLKTVSCEKRAFPANPDDACLKLSDQFELIIVYRLGEMPNPAKEKYSLIAQIKKLSDTTDGLYTATAQVDYAASLANNKITVDRNTNLGISESISKFFTKDGEIPNDQLNLNDRIIEIDIRLSFSAPSIFDTPEDRLYKYQLRLARINEIFNWINRMKQNPQTIPQKIKGVRIDIDSDERLSVDYPIYGFAYPGQKPNENAPQDCSLKEFTGSDALIPQERCFIFNQNRFVIYLLADTRLPEKSFLIEYNFPDDAPFEFTALNNTGKPETIAAASNPAKIESKDVDKTLGLRAPKSNLDVQANLTSSVSDVEENSLTVRKRKYEGTIDLRFAPWLARPLYRSVSGIVTLSWTPVFLDAKASLNNVDKDTLSTNRTWLSSELNLLIKGNKKPGSTNLGFDRDKFKLSFKFVNASDRDFKKAEAKFNFETLFYFTALNDPLATRTKQVPRSDLPKDAPVVFIPTGSFGYQIQPLVGFDFGWFYRNKRDPFENEEQSKFVRRLYFGLDMQFDLTRRFQLKIKDTYYLRGGVSDSIDRNYFSGTLETPVGTLGRGIVQSAFFSFERGNEPPFVGNGVNTFKIGYRLNLNFGRDGAIY